MLESESYLYNLKHSLKFPLTHSCPCPSSFPKERKKEFVLRDRVVYSNTQKKNAKTCGAASFDVSSLKILPYKDQHFIYLTLFYPPPLFLLYYP